MPDGKAARPGDVTIVVSSHNQAEFLEAAIASALGQTTACRVVVVDDGSTDGSADVAEAAGVETVRLPHRGAVETFRAGVELVETPFYCLLNGDDALAPSFVTRTVTRMEDPRVAFVYTAVELAGAQSGVIEARPFDRRALRWQNFAHGASLVRKSAYDAVGGYDRAFTDHHEDWALWVAMVDAGWAGVGVDEPLLRYRRHEHGSRNPDAAREFQRARWRIAIRHSGFYGPVGFARLSASTAKYLVLRMLGGAS